MVNVLDDLRDIKNALLSNKKVLTLEEFCGYTGFSKNYAYQLTSTGKIKFYRPVGKMIFFDIDDVTAFLLQNPSCTSAEIERKASGRLN